MGNDERLVIDDGEDLVAQAFSACPGCGAPKTRWTAILVDRKVGKTIYEITCLDCGHKWRRPGNPGIDPT